ncbi:MAG: succinate dehydrogenase [Chloroflexi bacterium]|nr:succinate dehydrogenase [Chloroflexota bacterium]
MAQATGALARERRYGKTQRRDRWWLEPVLVATGLGAFIAYSTVSALLGEHWAFEVGPYLSPFFEPLIRPDWLPDWFSPALFILPAPLAFRTTCYYYRRAYYRAYFMSPPACAVREPAGSYSGESRFPLVLQQLHRFALYAALVFVPVLWFGALRSYWHDGELGVGLGSVLITVNAFLLMMYTFGCHSLRHLVAGGLNCFSCSTFRQARHRAWRFVTVANEHHRLWAWTSLIGVGLTDLYIHLVANDVITDPNTWGSF